MVYEHEGSFKAHQRPNALFDTFNIYFLFNKVSWDFPGGAVVKNPSANAGDTGSSPGPGRSHIPRSN